MLDTGCGTCMLTVMIQQSHPEAEAVGSDPDTYALAIAWEKLAGPVRRSPGMRFGQIVHPNH